MGVKGSGRRPRETTKAREVYGWAALGWARCSLCSAPLPREATTTYSDGRGGPLCESCWYECQDGSEG